MRDMNKSKHKLNQPLTAEGKEQSPIRGPARELDKRSETVQASRGRSELNFGTNKDLEMGEHAAQNRFGRLANNLGPPRPLYCR